MNQSMNSATETRRKCILDCKTYALAKGGRIRERTAIWGEMAVGGESVMQVFMYYRCELRDRYDRVRIRTFLRVDQTKAN
jgi:hypothetical protein